MPWARVADALGMRTVAVPEAAVVGAGFGALRRAARGSPLGAPTTSTWLVGERHGRGVVVRLENFGGTLYTSASAEIVPPLLVGLRLWQPSFNRFGVASANPVFDRWGDYMVLANEDVRTGLALHAHDASLAPVRAMATAGHVAAQDSMVEIFLIAPGDEALLLNAIDAAALAARALSERSAALRWNPAHLERARQWEAFALNEGLELDHATHTMRGRVRGVDVEIALDPAPNALFTTVLARFRWGLGAGLYLRRDPRGLLVARRAPALDGVGVGDADFDAQFVIDALSVPQAIEVLKSTEARRLLSELASVSAQVVMNDREVGVATMAWLGPAELWEQMQALVRVVERITPEANVGPYR